MRATLIHQPASGSALADCVERVRGLLEGRVQLDVRVLQPGDETPEVARRALAAGSELLIASGGDGTVSAVASAAIGRPDARVAILPQGTANSVATFLGIPFGLEEACAIIHGGRVREVDTALVNGRPMLLMATVGVHADAVTETDPERKRKYGALAYVLEEVARIVDDPLFEATVHASSASFSCEVSAITVGNLTPTRTLIAQGPGGALEDDGLLDVTLIALRGTADAVATSFHLATRALVGMPANRENIAFFRTTELTVETREPKRIMIDGEAAGETPLVVRCVPRSLRVLVP